MTTTKEIIVIPPQETIDIEQGESITNAIPVAGYPRPNIDKMVTRLITLIRKSYNIINTIRRPTPRGTYRYIAFHAALIRYIKTALPIADQDLVDILAQRIIETLSQPKTVVSSQ